MSQALFSMWRDATLRPRTPLPKLVREGSHLVAVTFPAAWGALQSFMQAAGNNVGARSSLLTTLGAAIPIGALWGLIQVHLAALPLWVVARDGADPIPFAKDRHAPDAPLRNCGRALLRVGRLREPHGDSRRRNVRPSLDLTPTHTRQR